MGDDPPIENVRLLADRVLLGINIDEASGGGDLTAVEAMLSIETVGQVCPDTAEYLSTREATIVIVISEPQAGSDVRPCPRRSPRPTMASSSTKNRRESLDAGASGSSNTTRTWPDSPRLTFTWNRYRSPTNVLTRGNQRLQTPVARAERGATGKCHPRERPRPAQGVAGETVRLSEHRRRNLGDAAGPRANGYQQGQPLEYRYHLVRGRRPVVGTDEIQRNPIVAVLKRDGLAPVG